MVRHVGGDRYVQVVGRPDRLASSCKHPPVGLVHPLVCRSMYVHAFACVETGSTYTRKREKRSFGRLQLTFVGVGMVPEAP